MRVLLAANDDRTIASVELLLSDTGNSVVIERNGLLVVGLADSRRFDVIVIDTTLRGLNAFDLIHRLRQKGCQTPILIVSSESAKDDEIVLRAADITLNTATRKVTRGHRSIYLTKTEYSLLELLARNSGRVVSREKLVEVVWGFNSDIENSTVDTFLHMLRRKIDTPGERKLLRTIRGVGYVLGD